MNEGKFATRICEHCKMEKPIAFHFTPKAMICFDCKLAYKSKTRTAHVSVRKRRWGSVSMFQKKPFDWEGI